MDRDFSVLLKIHKKFYIPIYHRVISIKDHGTYYVGKTQHLFCRMNRQGSSEVDLTYILVQEFAQMLRTRTGEKLNDWLMKARNSQISEFRSFVQGIE